MSFVQAIQDKLCHPSIRLATGPDGKPAIQCQECKETPIPDVYAYIEKMSKINILGGCQVAQWYAEWSGDTNVPVSVIIMNIDGILPQRIEGQTLARVATSIKILKAINAPFTENSIIEPFTEEMNLFLIECANIIAANKEGVLEKNEKIILDNIVQSLRTILNSEDFQDNKFKYYFETLVPYVKSCTEGPLLPADDDDSNLVNQLAKQLLRSQAIRAQFGQFSLSFELFHVLAACYACCSNKDVVCNWFLDLAARICNGNFFWKKHPSCKWVQQVRQIVNNEMKSKRNMELYYVLRNMKQGDGIESLSENFERYAMLERAIREKIQAPADLYEMVCQQHFPATVFENHRDCMGFNVALCYIVKHLDQRTGQVQKGAFRSARKVCQVICKLMQQMQDFNSQNPLPWTMDTMKLFLASDPNIDKSLKTMAECLFDPQDGGEDSQ